MAYYTKVLRPGEEVQYLGRLHWVIYMNGALLLIIAAVLIAGGALFSEAANQTAMNSEDNRALSSFGFGAGVVGAILLFCSLLSILVAAVRRNTTEIVVTTSRVIFKVGLIGRRTAEMNISKIETVDVQQGIVGRTFGFGAVILRGTGSTFEPLRRIRDPLELRNAIMIG